MSQTIKVNFPELYKAQQEVIKSCLNSEDKYIILNGSRQVGKTLILSVAAVYWALKSPGQTIMIVSPTDSQVRKIQKQIIDLLHPILKLAVKSYKFQSGDAEIIFNKKSVILFRSAASEDSLRGNSVTHLLLDECAFIKEETWNKILAPTLTVRGKKVLFCSTPRGANFFKKLYMRGKSGEDKYRAFKITWQENPFANIEFIREQQAVLPKEIYEQEYEGEFIDSSGVFKYVKELSNLSKSNFNSQPCVIGIDIAFKKDFTVAVCLSTDGKMLDYIRFNNVDVSDMVEKLYQFIQKWQPVKTIMEENNQGLPVYQLLRSKGVYNFDAFNTNSKSKAEIINDLMAGFSKKEINLLNEDLIIGEFEAFTYSISKSGNVQFAAAYGHDDIVMATAFAWYAKKGQSVGRLVFM